MNVYVKFGAFVIKCTIGVSLAVFRADDIWLPSGDILNQVA